MCIIHNCFVENVCYSMLNTGGDQKFQNLSLKTHTDWLTADLNIHWLWPWILHKFKGRTSNHSANSCCSQNDSIISSCAAEINIYQTERNIWSVQSLNTKHVSFGVGWCGSWKPLSHVPALFPSSIHRCPSDISSSSLVWQCVCHWCAWFSQTCIHYRGQQQDCDYVPVWETYTIFLLGN